MALPERLPSALEAVADVPLPLLDEAGLALLEGWFAAAMSRWPTRKSRRMTRQHPGRRVALRKTMSNARRTGFEPVELVRVRAARVPRRLVMVCDLSQSMQPYVKAYLHLARAAAVATPAEVFAFGTRLTRLTPFLVHKSPETAIALATDKVTDRFGGTRIATNLRALLASRHGDACRGAVLLIASDGWDSDPPEELGAAMARLRRRAHRVIWLNPRAASPGYEPLVGGMAAALPHCDDFLPADTLRALAAVIEAITGDGLSSRSRLAAVSSRA
jgi:uncharacterized protein with von Willebrand factor type A (vWA) domain